MKIIFCFLFSFALCICTFAQQSKLYGKWYFHHYQFAQPFADSLKMIKEAENVVIEFNNNNSFKTSKKQNGKETLIGIGSFTFNAATQILTQDGTMSVRVTLLNDSIFAFSTSGNTLFFVNKERLVGKPLNLPVPATLATITAQILNISNEEAVSFATIENTHLHKFAPADEKGFFTINDLNDNDSIKISAVGYQTRSISAKELKGLDKIYLTPDKKLLADVVVANLPKQITLNEVKSGSNSYYVCSERSIDFQIAQTFIAPKAGAKLQAITLFKDASTAIFRLNIYNYDQANNCPGRLLTDSIIEIKNSKRKVIVDVAKYNIKIPNDTFCVAIEWLQRDENIYFGKGRNPSGEKAKIVYYSPNVCISERANELQTLPMQLYLPSSVKGSKKWHNMQKGYLKMSATISYL